MQRENTNTYNVCFTHIFQCGIQLTESLKTELKKKQLSFILLSIPTPSAHLSSSSGFRQHPYDINNIHSLGYLSAIFNICINELKKAIFRYKIPFCFKSADKFPQ